MPKANGISASSQSSSNAAEKSIPELLPQKTQTLTDNSKHSVTSANEHLDKSAVDDANNIIESSSPVRQDMDNDGGSLLSTSFVVPMTVTDAAAATCHSDVTPPTPTSVPSLMQLARQALDSRTDNSGLTPQDNVSGKSAVSCAVASHVVADMFSEDDQHSMAEMMEVV